MSDSAQPTPVRLTWEVVSSAGLEETWQGFANTDRFNRAAGLGFHFKELPRPDGTVDRTGTFRSWGMNLSFEDVPFQYRAPEWFRKVRRFQNGPAAELVTLLRLKQEPGGTLVRYSVEVTPRSPLLRPLIAVDLRMTTRPTLDKAIQGLLEELAGKTGRFDPSPSALTPEADRLLDTAVGRIKASRVASALAQFLRHAPLVQQDRIQPLKLARLWNLPPQEVVEGCLEAVGLGVLSLRWDLICPSCRAPKVRLEALTLLPHEVQCQSCNIRFDGTFPDSVQVSFRPAPALRDFQVEVACLGSPGRHPHIVAQDQVEPGAAVDFALPLAPGPYRVRTWPARETCTIEVVEGANERTAELTIMPFDLKPARLRLRASTGSLKLKNVTDRRVEVILERLWRAPDVLTAGQLLEQPASRALLPDGCLMPGLELEIMRLVLLGVEVLEGGAELRARLKKELRALTPLHLHEGDGVLIATWPTAQAALEAARLFARSSNTRCALHVGPVMELSTDGERVPMGRTVDELLQVLRYASPGIPALLASGLQDREFKEVVSSEAASLQPSELVAEDLPVMLGLRYG